MGFFDLLQQQMALLQGNEHFIGIGLAGLLKKVFKAVGLYEDPPPPPDMSGAISANKEIAREQLAFAREQAAKADADRTLLRQREEEDRKFAKELALDQKQKADDQYDFYKENYRPLEKELSDRAAKFDEENYQRQLAGMATSDVQQAFAQSRESKLRYLNRLGVNPSSGNFRALEQDEALAMANANYRSRLAGIDMKNAMIGNAVNVGNRFAANNQASTSLGLQGNAQASGITMGTQNALNQNAQGVNQSYANALSGQNSVINAINSQYDNQLNAYNYNTQALASAGKTFGAIAGAMMADGGTVRNQQRPRSGEETLDKKGLLSGRGTGISDDIPAMLSKGEYVIPADVVKAKGVEFFDKLIDRYHTPAAVQRARGLKE